jgi:hypothetical protein
MARSAAKQPPERRISMSDEQNAPIKALSKEMLQIIDELKGLRKLADEAQLNLIRRARRFELQKKTLWSQFYISFDAMLEHNNICDSARYRNITAADEKIGQKVVDSIGSHAAVEVVKITNLDRVDKYVEAAAQRYKDEGVPWSEQESKKQRIKIVGTEGQDSIHNLRATRERMLDAENKELRQKVRELEHDLKERDKEILKLKARLEKEAKKVA